MNSISNHLLSLKRKAEPALKWARMHRLASALIIVALAGGLYWYHKSSAVVAVTYVYASVETGPLSTTVSGSGQISGLNQIEVKPKSSGAITWIAVKPGQRVEKGQTLFAIDARDAEKAVRDAELNVQVAQFELNNSERDFENSKTSQNLSLNNQLTTLNSTTLAVPDKDNFQTNIISISGVYSSPEQGRYTLETYACLSGVCLNYTGIESNSFLIHTNVPTPLGKRGLYVTFSTEPVAGGKWYVDVPSPLASSYASNNKSYTEKVQSVKEAIYAAEQSVKAKALSLTQKQNALLDANQNLSDYYVRALFAGTISSVPVQLGEVASPSTVLTTLITDDKVAEVSLNEVDAAKVSLGQEAKLTFDALPDVLMRGTVTELDALGTENQGVVTYNAKVSLNEKDPRVKPGMSVSTDIVTASKDNVLNVPNSAIKTVRGKSYVEVPSATSSTPTRIPVEVGISNDTRTEIVSGLTAGERIVGRSINAAAAAAAPAAPSLFGGGAATKRTTR